MGILMRSKKESLLLSMSELEEADYGKYTVACLQGARSLRK